MGERHLVPTQNDDPVVTDANEALGHAVADALEAFTEATDWPVFGLQVRWTPTGWELSLDTGRPVAPEVH